VGGRIIDIQWVFLRARRRPEGSGLGLSARLLWHGYGGLTVGRTNEKLKLLRVEQKPQFLLLFVGGNDIMHFPVKDLIKVVNLLYIICQEQI
jgi:hypothetical protein